MLKVVQLHKDQNFASFLKRCFKKQVQNKFLKMLPSSGKYASKAFSGGKYFLNSSFKHFYEIPPLENTSKMLPLNIYSNASFGDCFKNASFKHF